MAQTKKTTTKKTPLQIVKDKFGGTKTAAPQTEKGGRRKGESKAEYQERKKKAPAAKKEKCPAKLALVAQLVDKLERREGETKAEFEKRLYKVPARKLLTLAARVEEVAKAGGRVGLTVAIHDAVQKKLATKGAAKEDKNLKANLAGKTLGALLDTAKAVEKKARKVAKKA